MLAALAELYEAGQIGYEALTDAGTVKELLQSGANASALYEEAKRLHGKYKDVYDRGSTFKLRRPRPITKHTPISLQGLHSSFNPKAHLPHANASGKTSKHAHENHRQLVLQQGRQVKAFDTCFSSDLVSEQWELYYPATPIGGPAQGDGLDDREGNRIIVKELHIQGTLNDEDNINNISSGLPEGNYVKIALVWDKQANESYPSASDVYSSNVSPPKGIENFRNMQYTSRFKVLHTVTVDFPQKALAVSDMSGAQLWYSPGDYMPFQIHLTDLHIPVQFTGTTADIANIQDNNFFIMAVCAKSLDGFENINITYCARCRFVG
jgi:hypothetical protein